MSYLYLYCDDKVKYSENVQILDFKKISDCTLSFEILVTTENDKVKTSIEDLSGFHVDALFAPNKWERVVAQTDVFVNEKEKFCLLSINKFDEEKIEIKNVTIGAPLGKLFDGGRLYQLPPAHAQSMGYVYVTKKGSVVVVDGGGEKDTEKLSSIVMKWGGVIDHLFVTHYHNDHICAVIGLFKENKVKIKNIYFDFPQESVLEKVNDDDNHLVKDFIESIPNGISVIKPSKGDKIKVDELTVTVLNDACFEIRPNFCNDSCVMYKFDTGKSKILFTGDIGDKGDDYIMDEWFCKEISDCNVVQMAHHGQRGASKAFYDQIHNIEVCLYPAPWWLFNGWDTPRTRSWMRAKGVLRSYPCIPHVTIEIK